MLPIIIKYKSNNTNYLGESASDILKNLSGEHKCYFHYSTPNIRNNKKRIRIKVDGADYGIIVEIDKTSICFCNPFFNKERKMEPVNEDDGLTTDCEIIFLDAHQEALTWIIEHNFSSVLPDISTFIKSCSNIKKPIVPVVAEREKEIWTAYCEGLNALNRERREFISINYVGNPILYNDTRQGEIYTLKLGLKIDSDTRVREKLKLMLDDKYQLGDMIFSDEQKRIDISFKGIEKINDEDLEIVSGYLHTLGYSITQDGVYNLLRVSVALESINKISKLYDQLDEMLQNNGVVFVNNEKLEYNLSDDSQVPIFKSCVEKIFGSYGYGILCNNFKINVTLNPEQLSDADDAFINDDHIVINNNSVQVIANSREEYNRLVNKVYQVFYEMGVEWDYPDYQSICRVYQNRDESYTKKLINNALEKLKDLRKQAYNVEIISGRVIRLCFKFVTAKERDSYLENIKTVTDELECIYKVIIKKPLGFTTMTFERDPNMIQRIEDELKNEYINEEIKLVDGKTYNDLFKTITDPYNINDAAMRERYNRFMYECPVIGVCHKRGYDYIIVNLSEEFYNGERFAAPIRQDDMIYFPSVGASTELRRQSDAIKKINSPGKKLPNGKIIPPLVNPALCQFLFNPVYAHEITSDIDSMMRVVERHKLEEHLNMKQIEAVAKAVLADDLCLIQGPPGTGKTTVIAEIIWQEILKNPKCKILLTSQTNLAVDNALERLKYKKEIRPLRIISELSDKSDDFVYNANILDEWVSNPNEKNSVNVVNSWIDGIIDNTKQNEQYKNITREWREFLEKKDTDVRGFFVDLYKSGVNLIAATCSLCGSQQFIQTFSKMFGNEDVQFDIVIMDEASKATPLEMAIPMVLAKKIIVIGDHKQLPPVLDDGTFDTALKKIGREDLAKKICDLKESQFKKLFQMAQKYRTTLVTTLNTQYRMHKDIMKIINQFYVDELGENGLICGIEETQDIPDYSIRGSRWHGITCEPFINPSTHAIWVNVVGREEKSERGSYKNLSEIRAIETVVTALTHAQGFAEYINAQKHAEDQEIGLITFYSSQRREIKRLEQSGALNPLYDYRIDVVDRFQGMERNIVIVSTVRSNEYHGIGFAKEIERINVAFSRAKSLLIVIGNRDLFISKNNYKQAILAMENVDIKQIEDMISYGKERR